MFSELQPNKKKKKKKTAHKNTQVFSYDKVENKLCKASVF